MDTRLPKTYAEVVDEFLGWNRNAGAAAPKFKDATEYAKFMDQREGTDMRSKAYDPNFLQQLNAGIERAVNHPVDTLSGMVTGSPEASQPTYAGPGLADLTGAMGAVGGSWMDKLVQSTPMSLAGAATDAMMPSDGQNASAQPSPGPFETTMEGVGQSMPRTIAQVGTMMTPAAPLAYADAALQAYAPEKSLLSAAVAPATLWAGGKVIPAAGRIGEQVATKAFETPFQDLVQGSSQDFGQAAAKMLTPNPIAENAIAAGRLAGGAAGMTGVNELGRQVTQGPHIPTVQDVAGDVVASLAFAPVDLAHRTPPSEVRRASAMQSIREAQAGRIKKDAIDNQRGQRLADTHKEIVDAASAGQDPTSMFDQIRTHYGEADASRQPTTDKANAVLMTVQNDASSGKFSELDVAQIMNAVTGRFDEIAKNDPQAQSAGTISGRALSDLVSQGLLPRITPERLDEITKLAEKQSIGDGSTFRSFLVNQIVADYSSSVPSALEARAKLPRPGDAMSKQSLDAKTEADKDVAYMQSLLTLMPHMKGKKAPDGKTALDEAMIGRDTDMSNATQSGQLSSESTAWARYDTWKDAIIRLAGTYDPVTRMGEWTPSKRMSDGTVIEGTAQPMSIEDLVAKEEGSTKNYKVGVMAKKKINTSVTASSSLDELLADAKRRFAAPQEGDIRENPESFVEMRKRMLGDDEEARAEKVAQDESLVEPEKIDPEAITSEDKTGTEPFFDPTNERQYDAVLVATDRILKNDEASLWAKYGGAQVGSWNPNTPGKAENFKNAILSRIEWDALSNAKEGKRNAITSLSQVQKDFYNKWRENNPTAPKLEELPTWKATAAAFRHAQRLYWPRTGFKFTDLVGSMLADKPEYQKMLAEVQQKPQETGTGLPENLAPSRYYQATGVTNPVQDIIRLGKGYAMKNGYSPEDADNYAVMLGKLQQAFPENTIAGKIVTPAKLQGANFTLEQGRRPWVGLNLDSIDKTYQDSTQRLVRGLQVFAHELAHNYGEGVSRNTSFSKQRADAHALMRSLFTELGPDATNDLLNNVISEVFIPPQYRSNIQTSLTAPGSNFADEAVSKLMEYTMLGAFSKSNPYQTGTRQGANTMHEAFLWMPQDVQGFVKLAFRDIANFTGGLEDYYGQQSRQKSYTREGDNSLKTKAFIRPMMDFANQFLDGTQKLDAQYTALGKRTVAALNASGSVDMTDPTIVMSSRAMDARALREIASKEKISFTTPEEKDPYGFQGMQQDMFPPTATANPKKFMTAEERQQGQKLPGWSHLLGQFYQMMRRYEKVGVQLAEPVTRLFNSLEPSYWRLTQDLHRPFTITDEKGNIKYDPNHPVQQILQNKHPQSGKAFQAMRNLALWSQDNQRPVTTYDQSGKLTVHPDATNKVKEELSGLAPEIQQGVLEGIGGLVEGYRRSAEMRYSAESETVATQIAKFFMMKDKGLYWDGAFKSANLALNEAVNLQVARNNVESAQQALVKAQEKLKTQPQLMNAPLPEAIALQQAQQQLAGAMQTYGDATKTLTADQQSVMGNYVFGQAGVAQGLVSMANMFKSREGWFLSEARPGRFLVFAKTPEGKQYANGKRERSQAETLTKSLASQGYTDINVTDRQAAAQQDNAFDTPDAVVNDFLKIERASWQNFLKHAQGLLDENDYAALTQSGYEPGMASQKAVENKSLDRYLQARKLQAGREELNPFEVFTDYTRRMTGTVARRGLRQQIELLLRDPRARNQGEFQQSVREGMTQLMQPISDDFNLARAGITAMYLGMPNIISPLVEVTQAQTSIFPELVREGKSWTDAVKRFSSAPVNIHKFHDSAETLEGRRLLSSARQKEANDPRLMTKDEAMALYYNRSKDEGRFSHGVAQQEMLARDFGMLRQWSAGMGMGDVAPKSKGELAKDSLYWLARMSMAPYGMFSGFNNKVAFMSGLDMLYDQGFRGSELYDRAHVFKDRATFGGGKPNEVGYVSKLSNPRTRSWFSLVNTLQRYAFGQLTQYKDFVADALGKTGLPPTERLAATKALAHALAAQTILGGALAVPGAMIMAGILSQFGIDVKQKGRDFVFDTAKRLGADDPLAVKFANVAQNGVGGQFLGVDLSSRFAINSFLGFDAYEGFDATKLAGPAGGLIESAINAGKFAAKGEMVEAAKKMVPPSLAPTIDIANQHARFGDVGMRSQDGRLLFKLTPGEEMRYAAGVRPYRYRTYRDEQAALRSSDESYKQVADQSVDEAASALRKGDTSPAFAWVQEYVRKQPMADPREAMSAIVDRALVQTNAQDLLAKTTVGNNERAQAIAQSFGDSSRQSEVNLLLQRQDLNARTGFAAGKPATAKDVTKAALLDALVQSGMTRQQAGEVLGKMGY